VYAKEAITGLPIPVVSPSDAAAAYVPYSGASSDINLNARWVTNGYLDIGGALYNNLAPVLQDDNSGSLALGTGAGYAAGFGNIAIGYDVLTSEFSGQNNFGMGLNTAFSMNGGNDNIIFGFKSAQSAQSPQGNIVLGNHCAQSLAYGTYNVFIGDQADPGYDIDNMLFMANVNGSWIEAVMGSYMTLSTGGYLTLSGYGSGMMKVTGGLVGTATADTDYATPNNPLMVQVLS
jgi:hypothetical protein